MDETNACLPARNALRLAEELRIDMAALERRVDRNEQDRVRLGERVTASEERMSDHESLQHEAVKKMGYALDSLNETVGGLKLLVDAALSSPTAVPIALRWKDTPLIEKSKLAAAVVAVLLMPDVLRHLLGWTIQGIAHVGGILFP